VVGLDARGVPEELKQAGVKEIHLVSDLEAALPHPWIVFLYVPAGTIVDALLDELLKVTQPDDVIIDGGNSYWGDSITRFRRLKQAGVHFLDLGTSGGVTGARDGACFMVGGERTAVAKVEPLLRTLAVANGYVHAGGPGAGHFAKLVHNGIEFGMLQAIGEGIDLLESYREPLPVRQILRCWRNGSVIRSWLIDLIEQQYGEKKGLATVPPVVDDTGEVNWLVDDAMHMEVSIPVIAQSVMQLIASRDAHKNWARAIALMRQGFGGHPLGRSPNLERERREGRIGGFLRDDQPLTRRATDRKLWR